MTATLPPAPAAAPAATTPGSPGGGTRRRNRVVAAVLGAVVVAAALAWLLAQLVGGGAPADTTVDRATEPNGLRAFVLLLEAFGAEVDEGGVAALAADPDVVLVLPGADLAEADVERLVTWMEGGRGTVVDAAGVVPTGSFVGPEAPNGSWDGSLVPGRDCDVPAVGDVEQVVTSPEQLLLVGDPGRTVACFQPRGITGEPAYSLAVDVVGAPRASLVVLAGVAPFTNRYLGEVDNAVLATSLFAPVPGTEVLLVHGAGGLPTARGVAESGGGSGGGIGGDPSEQPDDGGGSEEPSSEAEEPSLLDQLPVGVTMGLLQLLVAFVLYAWWRGRRVGAPVSEPQPVDIEGSELVAAVGDLLARTGAPERAAAQLRGDARRVLASRLGMSGDVDVEAVVAAVAHRTGRPPEAVAAVLDGPDPHDGDGLLTLAVRLDALREEVLHGVRA